MGRNSFLVAKQGNFFLYRSARCCTFLYLKGSVFIIYTWIFYGRALFSIITRVSHPEDIHVPITWVYWWHLVYKLREIDFVLWMLISYSCYLEPLCIFINSSHISGSYFSSTDNLYFISLFYLESMKSNYIEERGLIKTRTLR